MVAHSRTVERMDWSIMSRQTSGNTMMAQYE
jgi:hypothetical protein